MSTTKTVLFFPLNSPGHINSSLGIADRLKDGCNYRIVFLVLGDVMDDSIRRHGHELVILNEVNVYEDYEIVEETQAKVSVNLPAEKKKFPGAMKWPHLLGKYQNQLFIDPIDAITESGIYIDRMMIQELIENHHNYEQAIRSLKPDVIIIDHYFLPPCIVGSQDTPWVRLFSANPFTLTRSKLPDGIKPPPFSGFKLYTKKVRNEMRQNGTWDKIVDEWRSQNDRIGDILGDLLEPMQKLMRQKGCSPVPDGYAAHDSPHLNVYVFPEALDYDQEDDLFEYTPRWFRCNSLIRIQSQLNHGQAFEFWSNQLRERSRGKSGIIYFSLGSLASGMPDLVQKFVRMLESDTRRLYVVCKGVNGDKVELADNMIGDNYLPQPFFLQRADLAIVHGGNNSVTECLHYGIPMIVIPVFADQFDNGQRIEDLRLGKRLDIRECTQELLLESIETVLADRELIERVHRLGSKMRATNDADKVTKLIIELVENQSLDERRIDEFRKKDLREIS